MSWQAYVDSSIVGSGKFTAGCILGLDGTVWATSPSLEISPAESVTLIAAFGKPAAEVAKAGLHIAGTKYVLIRHDEGRSIYGRGAGGSGVICVKSGQAVLIGTYAAGEQPGEAAVILEKLADYLISVGY